MNYVKTKGLLPFFLLFLVSCSTIMPKSFDQSLMIGYSTQTAALNTTTGLLQRGQISKKDAQIVMEISDQAGKALDSARAMRGTDMGQAEAQLSLATNILDQISIYLSARKASK